MAMSPEKRVMFSKIVMHIALLLDLPYGAGKLAEPGKRMIAREAMNRFTAAELGQVSLGEFPLWLDAAYVKDRFKNAGTAGPAYEPIMSSTSGDVSASRLNMRAQDVFLTMHREALQRTLATRCPRNSPQLRPLWRAFGCRRYRMLQA